MLTRDQNDVAAAPTVAAARTAARNELLSPECQTAVAAVAGLDGNYDFINEKQERLVRRGEDVDELAHAPTIAELDDAGDRRKQRIVLAKSHVLARFVARTTLANDDGASGHNLTREYLDSQPLRIRVAAVFGTA
jgi:hypothetical protein